MSWIMEHPWMTFFLALAAMEATSNIVSAICTAVVSCKQKECEQEPQQTVLPSCRDCGNMETDNRSVN